MSAPIQDERILDLLTQQATEGLASADAALLERLVAGHDLAEREALERAAAAVTLAGNLDDAEPLPGALRARLLQRGEAWLRESGAAAVPATARGSGASGATTTANAPASLAAARAARATTDDDARARLVPDRRGWWAAAAAVLLALAGWYPRFVSTPAPVAAVAQTPGELRAQLLREVPSTRLVRWGWAATADPAAAAGVQGDVVWDPATQTGYMRFVGLAANDARRLQYQLWIFDAERDQRYPVDGGVFDVPAGASEVVVPIRARLAVAKPALFAVTAERAGGVVVSSRERIVVLAKPDQA